jgi:hypothetical protein
VPLARSPFALASLILGFAFVSAATSAACSTDTDPSPDASNTPDATADRALPGDRDANLPPDGSDGEDASTADAGPDANCPATKVVAAAGETCVGFGKHPDPCDTACGIPAYGYACFEGSPPGFTGCVQARDNGILGETYCCPDNACVAQPDQDGMCAGVEGGGKPKRYQCPPNDSGGNVAPPAGCVEHNSGGSPVEKFYCCP